LRSERGAGSNSGLSPKVTFVGAGSAVFARQLMTDILAIDGLDEGEFGLVDVDPQRLGLADGIARRLVELSGKRWSVTSSTERIQVLEGSDYVISSIEVAGLDNVRADYEIPMRYGVDQCIGDTIGPGGIFKALRTGPVWLEIVADIARLAPRARVINYSNPMSILTLAAAHFKVPREKLSPDDDFFKVLGIDSLQTLDLLTKLENHFHVELPDYELQGVTDFRTLAARIQARL